MQDISAHISKVVFVEAESAAPRKYKLQIGFG
jgi:hypothetical protein